MNRYLLAILLLLNLSVRATTRKVLFIGNSYTYTNTMPSMLQAFAAASGDTLIFDQSDPGGYTLAQHSVYSPTLSLIFSQHWDLVVLQEQSELPSFPPAEVDTEVYPYAHKLDSLIHANDSCTQTMFMMTWGHANGDPLNCGSYPVICTYAGMQGRLRESYLQMTHDNNAIVAPVGAAWKVVMDSFPSLWLYQADSSHPVVAGSYLETCVLYASIFHKPARGCTYLDGLPSGDATILQRIADKVVLDSLSNWQQYGHYPSAAFSYSATGTAVAFTSGEPILSQHSWSTGDGGHDTARNPVHTYSSSGTYTVTHTVYNSCFTETQSQTVRAGVLRITQPSHTEQLIVSQSADHDVSFASTTPVYDWLDIYATDGRKIGHHDFSSGHLSVRLPVGVWIYRSYSNTGLAEMGKVGVW